VRAPQWIRQPSGAIDEEGLGGQQDDATIEREQAQRTSERAKRDHEGGGERRRMVHRQERQERGGQRECEGDGDQPRPGNPDERGGWSTSEPRDEQRDVATDDADRAASQRVARRGGSRARTVKEEVCGWTERGKDEW